MQLYFIYLYKYLKHSVSLCQRPMDSFFTYLLLFCNGAKFSSFRSFGVPKVNVGLDSSLEIGPNFTMNNREYANPIGRFKPCSIIVSGKGRLNIGKNVGMSSSGIVCHDTIKIGDNVQLGGNVIIYDTDFHSLDADDRKNPSQDKKNTRTDPVIIEDNVFIGSHTTILKGVHIGSNSVIGACSLVTKSVPENEIWAGNPARRIRKSP